MYKKYEGKKVLIIGGGTSTLDRNWEKLDYDFIWTCNDFFLEDRILNSPIDLYLLGYMVDLVNPTLISKLREEKPTVLYEPIYYRDKQKTPYFTEFREKIDTPIFSVEIPFLDHHDAPAQKAGAAFRLILLASQLRLRTIYFVGFDGFDKDFGNIHAFTKHRGLKDSDTRREWGEGKYSYYNIFTEAYKYLTTLEGYNRFQNIGEGLPYNIGTPISLKFFPLSEKVKQLVI